MRVPMWRHLLLATFSFAVVAIAVFPYWIAVERLEAERGAASGATVGAAVEAPAARAETSPQCTPTPEVRVARQQASPAR